jgi:hypothetical protein
MEVSMNISETINWLAGHGKDGLENPPAHGLVSMGVPPPVGQDQLPGGPSDDVAPLDYDG